METQNFGFFGQQLPYAQQICNGTKHNRGQHIGERTIEVPIAREWIKQFSPFIEVGAVMPYWTKATSEFLPYTPQPHHVDHTVIDIADGYNECVRTCASQVDYKGLNVLCLSTIEHIGRGDYGLDVEDGKAAKVLEKIIAEAANYLISFPVGYFPPLDAHVRASKHRQFYYKQIDHFNHWIPIYNRDDKIWECTYDKTFPYANAVVFITNW